MVSVEFILADELSSGRKIEPESQWEHFDYNNRSERVSNGKGGNGRQQYEKFGNRVILKFGN